MEEQSFVRKPSCEPTPLADPQIEWSSVLASSFDQVMAEKNMAIVVV